MLSSESTAIVTWKIPEGTEEGTYMIWNYGDYKHLTGGVVPFNGHSSESCDSCHQCTSATLLSLPPVMMLKPAKHHLAFVELSLFQKVALQGSIHFQPTLLGPHNRPGMKGSMLYEELTELPKPSIEALLDAPVAQHTLLCARHPESPKSPIQRYLLP